MSVRLKLILALPLILIIAIRAEALSSPEQGDDRVAAQKASEAMTLSEIGLAYKSSGRFRKALDYYGQAAALMLSPAERRERAALLSKIGELYEALGENSKALDHYSQSMSLYVAENDRVGIARVFNKDAMVYCKSGDLQNAFVCCEHALSLFRAAGERQEEGNTLCNIGTLHRLSGDSKEALDYYNQALQIRRSLNDRWGEATILNNIGFVYSFLIGDGKKALDHFNQALPLLRSMGDRSAVAAALYGIAIAERDLGNLQEARNRIEEAINIVELFRAKVSGQELRDSYFVSKKQLYEVYIDLLMRLHKLKPSEGYAALALNISERARAQILLEALDIADADIRQGADPKLVEQERLLYCRLNDKAEYQLKLFNSKPNEEQAKVVAEEIDQIVADYRKLQMQLQEKHPYYAALTLPQLATAKQIQEQVLDDETLLLEYSLGEDRSFLWVLGPGSIESFELPKRDEIESTARRVYKLLTEHSEEEPGVNSNYRAARRQMAAQQKVEKEYIEAATGLSRMVLGPAADLLGKKRLLVVSDGALQYVPFGALPEPVATDHWPLIVNHEIVNLPSASALFLLGNKISDRKPAVKTLLAITDPVFSVDDERVKVEFKKQLKIVDRAKIGNIRDLALEEAAPFISEPGHDMGCESCGTEDTFLQIARLPGARDGVKKILNSVPVQKRREASGFAANAEMALSNELSQYSIIHFATHGFFNNAHPELSGLLLSLVNEQGEQQKGFLPLPEIFNFNLSAELVVLSSCRTGLVREIKDGPAKLMSGFLYAGAARVVANLWKENDKAKEDLMVRFYQGMIGPKKMGPAAALRAAQISMWRESRWREPWYWAAYVLYGQY